MLKTEFSGGLVTAKSDELKHVDIYTDGGSKPNPGPGGYAAVLLFGEKRKEISKAFRKTTNNRMELSAAIAGLEALQFSCKVTLYTDSKYLADGISKGWAKSWRRNGWVQGDKTKAINPDLWAKLLDLCETHKVTFEWVRGHSGNPENERCDELSTLARESKVLSIDEGYENPGR